PWIRSFPVIVRGGQQAPGHGRMELTRGDRSGADTREGTVRPRRRGRAAGVSESGCSGREADYPRERRSSRRSLYSTESTRACQDASMMFQATPTVPHVSSPSAEVIRTRVLAAGPLVSDRK